ncbi:hypothetical protein NC653_004839 [Populus alba x Populus x berolinensis]|uniref:Uncharacterized protein n=1 Tax=Populus alba x Populus x berolinensis TaxID=444605 RepID=A0AAD6RUZ0_9ROSI|nr:hypothetical protein NC653_004839 [Populus alba x Populus x berolinensis]
MLGEIPFEELRPWNMQDLEKNWSAFVVLLQDMAAGKSTVSNGTVPPAFVPPSLDLGYEHVFKAVFRSLLGTSTDMMPMPMLARRPRTIFLSRGLGYNGACHCRPWDELGEDGVHANEPLGIHKPMRMERKCLILKEACENDFHGLIASSFPHMWPTRETSFSFALLPTKIVEEWHLGYCRLSRLDSLPRQTSDLPFPCTGRRPSGCVISRLANGYSRRNKPDQSGIFNQYVYSGMAFGVQHVAWYSSPTETIAREYASPHGKQHKLLTLGVIPSPEARKKHDESWLKE